MLPGSHEHRGKISMMKHNAQKCGASYRPKHPKVHAMVQALQARNVYVAGRRTSMRLEQSYWDALAEIAQREGTTVGRLVTMIAGRMAYDEGLTRSVRVFCLAYFRDRATALAGMAVPARPARKPPTPPFLPGGHM